MATPTLNLLNHTELDDADDSTNWTDLTTADTDIKKEGSASMSGILRSDGEEGYYTAASAPVTAAGKTFRGWFYTTNLPYMQPESANGYQLLMYDGSTTEYKVIFGSDTYKGGFFYIVWDCDDFTTLTLANVRRWGVRANHTGNAKNVVNSWIDVLRYLDGYSMTGGSEGDWISLAEIAAADEGSSPLLGYGIVIEYESVYYASGTIQAGTGATTTYFGMYGDILIFIDKPVAAGLYSLSGVGSGTDIEIKDSVIRSAGTTDATRFILDFTDSGLAACVFTDNLVVRASTVGFKSGQTATGNIFDNCGQITHGGADLSESVVKNYEGTANTSALIYNVAADPAGEMDDMTFIKGTAATHAIEFGLSSPTTINLSGCTFSGYNVLDGQNDSTFHVKRTSGTVTINLSGCTGNFTYRSDGATVVISASVTVTFDKLKDNTEVRVYKTSDDSVVGGTENATDGTPDNRNFAWSAPAGTNVYYHLINVQYEQITVYGYTVPSTNVTIDFQQQFDRNYDNP